MDTQNSLDSRINSLTSSVATLIVLQLLTFAAIGAATWLVHTELKAVAAIQAANLQQQRPTEVADWMSYVRSHNPTLGLAHAPTVMVEYTDFQCQFCKQHRDEMRDRLVETYGENMRLVLKHFPLEQIHGGAMIAAIAAQCAHRAGRFWEVEDRFFENPSSLSAEAAIELGQAIGLGDDYVACVENEETRDEIAQDIADGVASGVRGTPAFVINGRLLLGVQPIESFKGAIEASAPFSRTSR